MELLQFQQINPTTWVYISSLMTIGLFFKFGRFWSVRNIDLVLLILLAPGALLVLYGKDAHQQTATKANDPAMHSISSTDGEDPSNVAALIPEEAEEGNDSHPGSQAAALSSESGEPVREATNNAAVAPDGDTTGQNQRGHNLMRLGFIWLFAVGALLLLRLLIDPTMVRRPLLEPNLTMGGMTFVGCSLFAFLMANVINGQATDDDLRAARGAEQQIAGQETDDDDNARSLHAPRLPLLQALPAIATTKVHADSIPDSGASKPHQYELMAKTLAVVSHLVVVLGLVFVAFRHFGNIRMGIGAAALYLLVPYTSQITGHVDHVLPAALLVWAIACYRWPEVSGFLLGLATSVVYPLFLLPLWISFYFQRGLIRFLIGFSAALTAVIFSLALTSTDATHFFAQFRQMFGIWLSPSDGPYGIWTYYDAVYRYPVMAAFVGLCVMSALLPAQKNLGTLMSGSAAIMLATQFWHGHGGGLYITWYLPLVMLTVFRPNLEDRVALAVISEGWIQRGRSTTPVMDRAT